MRPGQELLYSTCATCRPVRAPRTLHWPEAHISAHLCPAPSRSGRKKVNCTWTRQSGHAEAQGPSSRHARNACLRRVCRRKSKALPCCVLHYRYFQYRRLRTFTHVIGFVHANSWTIRPQKLEQAPQPGPPAHNQTASHGMRIRNWGSSISRNRAKQSQLTPSRTGDIHSLEMPTHTC